MTTTNPAQPTGRSWRFARLTAPLARRFAGRRFFPLWAVVQHRGRRSGRLMAVPVAVRWTADEFVIALPWGAHTNWVRNVLAADGCVLRWRGDEHPVTAPELLGQAGAHPYYGRLTWAIVSRVFRPEAFLKLTR